MNDKMTERGADDIGVETLNGTLGIIFYKF